MEDREIDISWAPLLEPEHLHSLQAFYIYTHTHTHEYTILYMQNVRTRIRQDNYEGRQGRKIHTFTYRDILQIYSN